MSGHSQSLSGSSNAPSLLVCRQPFPFLGRRGNCVGNLVLKCEKTSYPILTLKTSLASYQSWRTWPTRHLVLTQQCLLSSDLKTHFSSNDFRFKFSFCRRFFFWKTHFSSNNFRFKFSFCRRLFLKGHGLRKKLVRKKSFMAENFFLLKKRRVLMKNQVTDLRACLALLHSQ